MRGQQRPLQHVFCTRTCLGSPSVLIQTKVDEKSETDDALFSSPARFSPLRLHPKVSQVCFETLRSLLFTFEVEVDAIPDVIKPFAGPQGRENQREPTRRASVLETASDRRRAGIFQHNRLLAAPAASGDPRVSKSGVTSCEVREGGRSGEK